MINNLINIQYILYYVDMDIVLTQRCISNLKSIYNYKKSLKQNIHYYNYFIKLFLIKFNLKIKEGVDQSIDT